MGQLPTGDTIYHILRATALLQTVESSSQPYHHASHEFLPRLSRPRGASLFLRGSVPLWFAPSSRLGLG